MLTRFHKILIGVLAIQLALAVVMVLRDDELAVEKPAPLLAGFDAAKVTRVQVTAGDGALLDLVKRQDTWVLASSYDYPADATKVSDLMSQIAKLAAAAPIATQASRHKQLGVADTDFERKLVITAGGKDTTLFVGGSAGLRRTAVRFANDNRVFAVSGISAYAIGSEPRQWVATTYSSVPEAEIAKLAIDKAGTITEITRDAAGTWTTPITLAAGETLDTDKLAKLVRDAATIELAAPADPKRAATPTATITIEYKPKDSATPAPTVIDVMVDGERYWVKTRGTDRAVLVDRARLDDVVGVERAKLVKKTAASTPSDPAKAG